jgi:hypothetical protein
MPTTTPATQSDRIETATHVIHLKPRISANKLAEYVLADPSRQSTIVKQAKNASKSITPLYHRVRDTFPHAHSNQGLNAAYFIARAEQIEASRATTDWQIRDKENSAKALRHLADMVGQIECASATLIPKQWKPLTIHGVAVSVYPEVAFSMLHRGVTKVGAVILNTSLNDGSSLAKGSDRYCVGDYVTTLLYLMLAQQLSMVGMPLHTKCYAMDIFRQKVYTAPPSYKTLVKHMDEACKMISLRWDSIPVEYNSLVEDF